METLSIPWSASELEELAALRKGFLADSHTQGDPPDNVREDNE
jgi:hypothetical protein